MKNNNYVNYITNQLGHGHANDFDMMERYFKKNFSRFIKDKNCDILDIGCGMGHLLFFLKNYGCKNVTGIDLSSECVEYCIENKLGDSGNLFDIDMDEFLIKKNECYDLIFLSDVIEHFQKEEMIEKLELIRSALKKDGKLIVKVVNCSNPITAGGSRYIDFTHTIGFTEESLAQVYRMSGYTEIKIYAQDIWVFNPFVNFFGKSIQSLINNLFFFLNLIYGRKSAKIFTKDIVGSGKK